MTIRARLDTGALGDIWRAIAFRYRWTGNRAALVEVPLEGGRAGLVSRRGGRRLVTVLGASGGPQQAGTPIRGWLERRQAGRSRLLIAPDRPTAVELALRWKIDPGRFRLVSQMQASTGRAEGVPAPAGAAGPDAPPWYRL